ncbi:MAG: hypothetical protein R2788_00345 [Saprospiraceae bacterium]
MTFCSTSFKQYNPELLDKPRVLAISKCDMIDAEIIEMMKKEDYLPEGLPTVFISSVSGFGIDKLKDVLWEVMNTEEEAEDEEELA